MLTAILLASLLAAEPTKPPPASKARAAAAEVSRARVEGELKKLETDRQKFLDDAQRQVAIYDGAIAGMKNLLAPPKDEEKPVPAPPKAASEKPAAPPPAAVAKK